MNNQQKPGSANGADRIDTAIDDMHEAELLTEAMREQGRIMSLLRERSEQWHNLANRWETRGYPEQAKSARDQATRIEALLVEAGKLEAAELVEQRTLMTEIEQILNLPVPAH